MLSGAKVRKIRLKSKLSQTALAALVGWGPSRISDIENGRIPDPRISAIERLAKALKTNVESLLSR